MIFKQLFDEASSTLTYIIGDPGSGQALIIDPVVTQLSRDLATLRALNLTLAWSVDSHVHADHVTGAAALQAATGCRTAVGMACDAPGYERQLVDGDTILVGSQIIHVLATPGHTPGSLSLLWDDRLFTGDTLLIGGCGRTDFQNGCAASLFQSVTRKLFTLTDETLVYPGHDYNGRRVSSIGEERTINTRFLGLTSAQFVQKMAALNLPPPKLLDIAVPANRLAGYSHAA